MTFKNEISLDDLALFLAVAETGTLTAAAQRSGVPLPTMSRRMRHLEDQLQRQLFQRGPNGASLTEDGRSLSAELGGLTDTRNRLRHWQTDTDRVPVVRITAGTWTASLLAGGLAPSPDWQPAFVATDAALDLARREADIGLRSRPPDHPWLARQRLRPVHYAIYGRDDGVVGLVGSADPGGAAPSQRWLAQHHGDDITITVSAPRLALDLAQAGRARALLPTFIGDAQIDLTRLSPQIDALSHDQWLVSHHAARHDAPIRAALTAIVEILS
jgi:DNA-binding transcriptional LysR family regulator